MYEHQLGCAPDDISFMIVERQAWHAIGPQAEGGPGFCRLIEKGEARGPLWTKRQPGAGRAGLVGKAQAYRSIRPHGQHGAGVPARISKDKLLGLDHLSHLGR